MDFDIKGYDFDSLVDEGRKLVLEELDRQLKTCKKDICVCNECVLDMAAMALNELSPRYRSSLLGIIYQSDGMSDPKYSTTLKAAVRNAIEKVGLNPGHN